MNDIERAVSCFKEGFNCAQAIFSTYGTKFGIDIDSALKIATGFGSGMGSIGLTCGAVTGAAMVLGLKHGRIKLDDKESKEKTYNLVNKFIEEFKSRNKSTVCKDLIDCDLSTVEGRKYAKEHALAKTICPKFVKDAAEILEKIL